MNGKSSTPLNLAGYEGSNQKAMCGGDSDNQAFERGPHRPSSSRYSVYGGRHYPYRRSIIFLSK